MSSQEDEVNELETGSLSAQEAKKRRVQRACDICRRKKIRCDGGQMPNNRCSNCITLKIDCTYVEAAKKRGPPKGYVENLENRLENMEKLLKQLCPDADLSQELGSSMETNSWRKVNGKAGSTSTHDSGCGSPSHFTASSPINSPQEDMDPDDAYSSDDDYIKKNPQIPRMTESFKRLTVQPLSRFHGKSSGATLVQAALTLKKEVVSGSLEYKGPGRRLNFWGHQPWERQNDEVLAVLQFPPDDLLHACVDNYFKHMNAFLPMLHRPTFENEIAEGKHKVDPAFGPVVLLVCAIGARWTDDPRVLVEGQSRHSAGWKFFEQLKMHRRSMLRPPQLYDLHGFALCALFLQGSSTPHVSWTIIGVGIRLAQDVGAHRRKVYKSVSVESELWKRAFWVLVCLDRIGSAALGRPCAIQEEDFDLDYPLEVDDEYWENPDPALAFKQPPGQPSSISFFVCLLKLNQTMAFALRSIYSINKSRPLMGLVGPNWEQQVVADLDSSLNKWIDSVPDHLRWDPHRENPLFFAQSATLYCNYYHLQILVHRPFIPSPRKPSPLAFPSLAICTNAARSVSHIVDAMQLRSAVVFPLLQISTFTSGVVLLLNLWGSKKSGMLSIDHEKQMADVKKCMKLLKMMEDFYISCGKLWDILNELAFVGDLEVTDGSRSPSNKRGHGSDTPINAQSRADSPQLIPENRPIAGRKSFAPMPNQHQYCGPQSSSSQAPSPESQSIPTPGPSQYSPDAAQPYMNPAMSFSDPTMDWMAMAAAGPSNLNELGPLDASTALLDIFQQGTPADVAYGLQMFQDAHAQQQQYQSRPGYMNANGSTAVPDPPTDFITQANLAESTAALMSSQALQMWSSVPGPGFVPDEWASYLHMPNATVQQRDDRQSQRQA